MAALHLEQGRRPARQRSANPKPLAPAQPRVIGLGQLDLDQGESAAGRLAGVGALLRRIGRGPDAGAGERGALPGQKQEKQEKQARHRQTLRGGKSSSPIARA